MHHKLSTFSFLLYNDFYLPLIRGVFNGIPYQTINDLLQSFDDCRLQILLDGREIFSQAIDLPPDSCRVVGLIEHPLPDGGRHLEVRLYCQGKVISVNGYDLQYDDPAEAGLLDRLRSWVGEMAIR